MLSQNVEQNMGYFCSFQKTTKNKQSPIGRIFAQFGHPARLNVFAVLRSLKSYDRRFHSSETRVTGCVCQNIAQKVAQTIFCPKNE
jgi:hypothetical protein